MGRAAASIALACAALVGGAGADDAITVEKMSFDVVGAVDPKAAIVTGELRIPRSDR